MFQMLRNEVRRHAECRHRQDHFFVNFTYVYEAQILSKYSADTRLGFVRSGRRPWLYLVTLLMSLPIRQSQLFEWSTLVSYVSIHQRALILFIQTLALYKSFTYLLTYLHSQIMA